MQLFFMSHARRLRASSHMDSESVCGLLGWPHISHWWVTWVLDIWWIKNPKRKCDDCILLSSAKCNPTCAINMLTMILLTCMKAKKWAKWHTEKTDRSQMVACCHAFFLLLSVQTVWSPSVALSISVHLSICLSASVPPHNQLHKIFNTASISPHVLPLPLSSHLSDKKWAVTTETGTSSGHAPCSSYVQ